MSSIGSFSLWSALRVDRKMRLAYWSEQGEFTPAQADRYRELLGLVECYRHTLDRLLAD